MPGQLKFKRVVITARDNGERMPALLAKCPECDGEIWHVYAIRGKHQHLQCYVCGTTYCHHDGPCHETE